MAKKSMMSGLINTMAHCTSFRGSSKWTRTLVLSRKRRTSSSLGVWGEFLWFHCAIHIFFMSSFPSQNRNGILWIAAGRRTLSTTWTRFTHGKTYGKAARRVEHWLDSRHRWLQLQVTSNVPEVGLQAYWQHTLVHCVAEHPQLPLGWLKTFLFVTSFLFLLTRFYIYLSLHTIDILPHYILNLRYVLNLKDDDIYF